MRVQMQKRAGNPEDRFATHKRSKGRGIVQTSKRTVWKMLSHNTGGSNRVAHKSADRRVGTGAGQRHQLIHEPFLVSFRVTRWRSADLIQHRKLGFVDRAVIETPKAAIAELIPFVEEMSKEDSSIESCHQKSDGKVHHNLKADRKK
jgi:hypothetical protein